jgi:hypothetical protein
MGHARPNAANVRDVLLTEPHRVRFAGPAFLRGPLLRGGGPRRERERQAHERRSCYDRPEPWPGGTNVHYRLSICFCPGLYCQFNDHGKQRRHARDGDLGDVFFPMPRPLILETTFESFQSFPIFSHTARYLPVTADGEALAITVPAGESRVLKHFQERMPYGLFVPDADGKQGSGAQSIDPSGVRLACRRVRTCTDREQPRRKIVRRRQVTRTSRPHSKKWRVAGPAAI